MNSPRFIARWIGCLVTAVALLLPTHGQAPSSAPSLSQADLEKLLGPIALYPDPLISIMLPAACYPLEIVEASRFVANTNNIPKIDEQSWDPNVKGIAKIPAALKTMNDDLTWTSNLGQAFLDQQKDVMDTIQLLRNKAQSAGTLKTSEQQIVIVTNMVTEKTIETKVVVVTNTIVQIEPANPQIVYVPQYVPSAVYYPPPTYNPMTPLITFGVGIAVGAIIANNCDWHYGGVYVGGGYGWGGGYHGGYYGGNNNVNVNNNVNINVNNNNNTINNIGNGNNNGNNNRPGNGGSQWKPDSAKLRTSGAPGAASAYQSREARGWGGSTASAPGASGSGAANRASTSASTFPGSGSKPVNSPSSATRPSTANSTAARPTSAPATTRPASAPAAARPAAAPASSPSRPSSSAFSGMNSGSAAHAQSNRGAVSRGGGAAGGARSGGGGGGGGRRR